MKNLIVCLIIAACTSSTHGQDPPVDGQGSGSNPIDSNVTTPPGYTDVPVACVDFVRTTVHTSSDGSKDVLTNSYAFFNFAPGDDFIVQSCQQADVLAVLFQVAAFSARFGDHDSRLQVKTQNGPQLTAAGVVVLWAVTMFSSASPTGIMLEHYPLLFCIGACISKEEAVAVRSREYGMANVARRGSRVGRKQQEAFS